MSEFSTFMDGEDCPECKDLLRSEHNLIGELALAKSQLKSARRIFKWFRDAESNIYLPDNAVDSIDQWLEENPEEKG